MTQEGLQDAIVANLRALFEHYKHVDNHGFERHIQVFSQDVPARQRHDEAPDPSERIEPYIVVRLEDGELSAPNEYQTVNVMLMICVRDSEESRQGHRDALHIVNEILLRYGANAVLDGRYHVKYPIRWAMQEEGRTSLYFAAVALQFEVPAIFQEVICT